MKPFEGLDAVLRSQIRKFTIVFVIASIIFYVALSLGGIQSEVGTLYFRYAEAMVSLNMPYSDFPAEYPPLAMLLILIPRLFSFSPFTYQIAFGVEVYAFLLFGLVCVHRLAESYSERPSRYSDLYIILSLALFDFILDRYDIFPMVLCLAALYFFKTDRLNLMWVMIAIGTMTKLYPALMAPVFLIYLCMNGRRNDALRGVGICVLIGCASMLPFLIADPGTMLMFLDYHMDRGMQTESLVSSFLMLLGNFGLIDVGYIFNFGSDNIYGPVPDAVAGVMLYFMASSIVIAYVTYGYVVRKGDGDAFLSATAACFIVILLFMLVNKVLSSQYLIWAIPFVVIMATRMERGWTRSVLWSFGGAVALTQINLIVNYALRDAVEPFSLLGIVVLMVRNILLVAVLVMVVRALLRPGDVVPEREVAGPHHAVVE